MRKAFSYLPALFPENQERRHLTVSRSALFQLRGDLSRGCGREECNLGVAGRPSNAWTLVDNTHGTVIWCGTSSILIHFGTESWRVQVWDLLGRLDSEEVSSLFCGGPILVPIRTRGETPRETW